MQQLVIAAILISLLNCSDKDDNDYGIDCGQLACTEQFVTIMVSVEDQTGTPVALNSFGVTIIDTEEDITREVNDDEYEIMKTSGSYPLFGDEYSNTYQKKTVGVNFKGFDEDDQEIVSVDFKVGADCCHVYLAEGKTTIITE